MQLVQLGTHYLEGGRICDAIDFFEKARHREGLDSLLERCVNDGDFFLYRKVAIALGVSPGSDEWTKLGDRALALGKVLFARSAYREAGVPEKLTQVERLLSELRLADKAPVQ